MKKTLLKNPLKVLLVVSTIIFSVGVFSPIENSYAQQPPIQCADDSDCPSAARCAPDPNSGLNFCVSRSYLGTQWNRYLGGLPIFNTNEFGEEVAEDLIRRAISLVKLVIGAAALLLGIIYAMGLVFSRGKEDQITKQKQNFLYVFVGFLILLVADGVAEIFTPKAATTEQLIDFSKANDKLRDITNYIKWLFGSIIVLIMTISGVRLVTAGGDEEVINKEKRHITWGGIGILVVLLASNIVNAIYVVNDQTLTPEAADAATGIQEIAGLIRLILVFLGPMAVLFTIYAGFLYMTALDNEEQVKKAIRMITTGVVAIAIIYASYALVNTFIGQPDAGLTPLAQ